MVLRKVIFIILDSKSYHVFSKIVGNLKKIDMEINDMKNNIEF